MTERLETVLEKISTVPNPTNSSLIEEFYQFMVDSRKSDSYKKNNLKALILFSHELAPNVTFYDIQKKEKILEFINKRIRPKSEDPDEKWITTWNDYIGRLKFFFRWLYNYEVKKGDEDSKIVVEETFAPCSSAPKRSAKPKPAFLKFRYSPPNLSRALAAEFKGKTSCFDVSDYIYQ